MPHCQLSTSAPCRRRDPVERALERGRDHVVAALDRRGPGVVAPFGLVAQDALDQQQVGRGEVGVEFVAQPVGEQAALQLQFQAS